VRRKAKAIGRQRLYRANHELVAREVQSCMRNCQPSCRRGPSRVKEAGHQAI